MTLHEDVQRRVLDRLGQVFIVARQAVESVLAGQHRSLRRGLSVEFAGHRPYQSGDDLRRLDWLVYARSDRYDVRVYEEETRLRTTLVLDASGSMAYGSGAATKLDFAKLLVAALGFLMVRQSDAVGLAVVDARVRTHLPPAGTMGHVITLIDHLDTVEAGDDTALGAVLTQLAPAFTRRGLVILVTDAFDDVASLSQALRLLRYRKQEVRVLEIIDAGEETFPFHGTLEVLGLEREQPVRLDGDRVRGFYQQALSEHRLRLSQACHELGVQLETIRTDEDLPLALARALAPRGRGVRR